MTELAPQVYEPPHVSPREDRRERPPRRWRILRLALLACAALLLAPYVLATLYIFVNPPFSALMLRQAAAGRGISFEWRDLDRISPNLIAQVIVSEDGRFCRHRGVDWKALDKAAEAAAEGKPRGGGSTIDMQTAKNLFLWNSPAILRKPFEVPLAYYLDLVLGKQRVMEIYLNIVEWAPGVFGAEAAAEHHFGKTADELTREDAALLAAALPNPKRRNAGDPGPRTEALANRLRARASKERGESFCVFDAGQESDDAD
ncbi:MAG: monofunctional biosynthetic peptidoglycan transglycosylase [Rhodomicrobium sp.]|jgi:monofunctional biosynthetic peptidoglycan transglycosylase